MQAGHDGFVIDPNGKSFIGKLGPDLKLMGKVRYTYPYMGKGLLLLLVGEIPN